MRKITFLGLAMIILFNLAMTSPPIKISVGSCYDPVMDEIVLKVVERNNSSGAWRLVAYKEGVFLGPYRITPGEAQTYRIQADNVSNQLTLIKEIATTPSSAYYPSGGTHVLHTREGFTRLYERGMSWAFCPSEQPKACKSKQRIPVWKIWGEDGRIAFIRDLGYDGTYDSPSLAIQRSYMGCDWYPIKAHITFVSSCESDYQWWSDLPFGCGSGKCPINQ